MLSSWNHFQFLLFDSVVRSILESFWLQFQTDSDSILTSTLSVQLQSQLKDCTMTLKSSWLLSDSGVGILPTWISIVILLTVDSDILILELMKDLVFMTLKFHYPPLSYFQIFTARLLTPSNSGGIIWLTWMIPLLRSQARVEVILKSFWRRLWSHFEFL